MIEINDTKNFEIDSILTCGQVFRFRPLPTDEMSVVLKSIGAEAASREGMLLRAKCYELFAGDKHATIVQASSVAYIFGDDGYFADYFDLASDYSSLGEEVLQAFPKIQAALEFGKGIRILKQELKETVISFIMSQNNNIKRIQATIERLCVALGTKTECGFAFPTGKQLACADRAFYDSIGCGYRSRYLVEVVNAMNEGFFDGFERLDTPKAKEKLLSLCGVGEKVANCILLFGLHRMDVCPIDTWMKTAYTYCTGLPPTSFPQMHAFFGATFGSNAGYAQQLLFNYLRNGNTSR
ncbi:MAG: DNA glycosylase [Clostridia bacterium]|nr:DNA glycosylase [Clostridia bacterium]